MPAVARPLVLREPPLRHLERVTMAFPVVDPAGEPRDLLVSELFERLRGERGAVARGAVDDDRPGAIGHGLLDPRLEPAARDVRRAGEVALVPLLSFADVEEERWRLARVELMRALGADLVDLP